MGRSIPKSDGRAIPVPGIPFHGDSFGKPTENKGIMSGPIRKPRRQGRRRKPRGSRPDFQLGRVALPDGSTLITYGSSPRRKKRGGAIGRRPARFESDFMSGPKQPSATMETRRVNVQDPTLGGPPEREVPIPRERRQRISRRSDPRGRAPFSPDERAMARDRFFERMFERSDERRQQRSMEREERDNVRDSLRSERGLRGSEDASFGDERAGEGRRRRRGGGRRRRRGRRRDFTRRRSRMEGGRRGRSGREMAAFRDQYVSTLR